MCFDGLFLPLTLQRTDVNGQQRYLLLVGNHRVARDILPYFRHYQPRDVLLFWKFDVFGTSLNPRFISVTPGYPYFALNAIPKSPKAAFVLHPSMVYHLILSSPVPFWDIQNDFNILAQTRPLTTVAFNILLGSFSVFSMHKLKPDVFLLPQFTSLSLTWFLLILTKALCL